MSKFIYPSVSLNNVAICEKTYLPTGCSKYAKSNASNRCAIHFTHMIYLFLSSCTYDAYTVARKSIQYP